MIAKVEEFHGRPAITIDGVPYPPMMATIRTMTLCDDPQGQRILFDRDYFAALGKAGVRIFFLICDTVWLKPNAIELFDTEARALLEAIPDAYIIPRMGMHPPNDWIEAHPDECARYSDGTSPCANLFTESYQTVLPHHYSLCSDVWRADAGKALEETWNALMKLPYADRIIGCFLAAGGTSEWYYIYKMFHHPDFDGEAAVSLDHSEAFRRQFSRYLRATYGTDELLQKHWKNPNATIEHPPIPTWEKHYYEEWADRDAAIPRERMLSNAPVPPPYENGTHFGLFTDFDRNKDTYDFLRAWHLGTADSILHFAKIIKKLTPNRLVGAFYGGQGATSMIKGGTSAGTVKILESDCVDFLAAPGVYENRQAGGQEGQREVQDSFFLHNKIYIVEQDTRTLAENRVFQSNYGIYDMTDTVNVMKRELGRNLCEEVQAWWFDQLLGGKRFKYPEIYQLIGRQQQIACEAYSLDRKKQSEIAFVYDEESLLSISVQSTRDLIEMVRNYEIAKIGAPVDQYYHNDLSDPKMPSYKMYVFFNTIVLTPQEREAIRAKLKKDHALAVWIYAPGLIEPMAEKKIDCSHMEALTGMHFQMEYGNFDASIRLEATDHPLSEDADTRFVYGRYTRKRRMGMGEPPNAHWDPKLFPLFYVADPDAVTLGRFCTTGLPAISYKECDGFASLYYGSKFIPAELLRRFAKYAGCHIFCESDDVTYIHPNYLTFHASERGQKTLYFPHPVDVFEVYEQRYYARNVTSLTFDTYLGETKMFRLYRREEK